MGLGYSKVEPDRSSEVLVLYLERRRVRVRGCAVLEGGVSDTALRLFVTDLDCR